MLDSARRLFSEEGMDAPMPQLAREVGAGIGSLYRLFESKDEVIALLVAERLDELSDRYAEAARADDTRAALVAVVDETVQECVRDHLTLACWEPREEDVVLEARRRAREQLDVLVSAVRDAGGADDRATGEDLRILFRSVNGAELIREGGARRLAELTLRGLGIVD